MRQRSARTESVGTAERQETTSKKGGQGARPGSHLRFVATFSVVAGLLCTSVVATNFVVDPRNEFPPSVFRPLVSIDPSLKIESYRQLEARPETLVLGSSTSQRLATPDLEKAGFGKSFNWGLNGNNLNNELAILRYVAAAGKPPERLVIGVDIFQLMSISPLYTSHLYHPEITPHSTYKPSLGDDLRLLISTFSLDYVRDTLRVFELTYRGYPEPFYDFDGEGNLIVRGQEGYKLFFTPLSQDAREAAIEDYVARAAGGMSEPLPEGSRLSLLKALVREARAAGIEVNLFIQPIHPKLAMAIDGDTGRLASFRGALNPELLALCSQGVHISDLVDPLEWGGNPEDFFDGVHYQGAMNRQIVEILAAGARDICSRAT